MKEKALKFLTANPLLYMNMIVPIQRGTAEIIYAAADGVLIQEKKSGAYMLTVAHRDTAMALLNLVAEVRLFTLHQTYILDEIKIRYGLSIVHSCVQAVYFGKDKLPINTELEIRLLQEDDFAVIWDHYHSLVDADYLQRRLRDGALYGGFREDALCGFIGEHEEGSIGLLEVFPEYRGNGYGAALTSFMVNRTLDMNLTPFSQVVPDNIASVKLHQKLGFEIATTPLYWLFNV